MDSKLDLEQQINILKSEGYHHICFLLPGCYMAGGIKLFSLMASYLAQHCDIQISFIDYADGISHDLLKDVPDIQFINYAQNKIAFPITEKVILFTNSTRVTLIKQLPPDSKIMLWHYETLPCAWESVFLHHETANVLNLLKENHALLFHDWSAKKSLEAQFQIYFDDGYYLPLNLENHYTASPKCLISETEINIIWLSRLSPDKVESLCNLMYNFSKYETSRKKRLHIIGDGLKKAYAEKIAETYSEKIECLFLGTLINDELKDYMAENGDIIFGMGTSILEGAELQIPSAIVQLSNAPFDDDAYIWLHDTKDYCVGISHDQKDFFHVNYQTFSDLIEKIYIEKKKKEYGASDFRFYKENFSSIEKMCCLLLRYINKSSLYFSKLNKLIRYCPYVTIEHSAYFLGGFKNLPGLKICEKRTFNRRTRYYLFGIRIFAIVEQPPKILYRLFDRFTIAYSIPKRKPYQFTSSRYKDTK